MALDRSKLLTELKRFQWPTALIFRFEDGTTAYVTSLSPWAEQEIARMDDRHGSPIGFIFIEPCQRHIRESKLRVSPIAGYGELQDRQNERIVTDMAIEFELMLKSSGPELQDEFCRGVLEELENQFRPADVWHSGYCALP